METSPCELLVPPLEKIYSWELAWASAETLQWVTMLWLVLDGQYNVALPSGDCGVISTKIILCNEVTIELGVAILDNRWQHHQKKSPASTCSPRCLGFFMVHYHAWNEIPEKQKVCKETWFSKRWPMKFGFSLTKVIHIIPCYWWLSFFALTFEHLKKIESRILLLHTP